MLTRDAVGGTPGLGHGIMTVIVVVLSGRIFPIGRDLHLGCAFDNGNETKKKKRNMLKNIIGHIRTKNGPKKTKKGPKKTKNDKKMKAITQISAFSSPSLPPTCSSYSPSPSLFSLLLLLLLQLLLLLLFTTTTTNYYLYY